MSWLVSRVDSQTIALFLGSGVETQPHWGDDAATVGCLGTDCAALQFYW